jgi:hypothetical protein
MSEKLNWKSVNFQIEGNLGFTPPSEASELP